MTFARHTNHTLSSLRPFTNINPLTLTQQIQANNARSSLKQFIHLTWHLVEPNKPLVWNWHLDVICEALEKITRGELITTISSHRLIINMPPGTGKSMIVMVFWPAWEWTLNASYRYLTASYSDKNTIRDNRRCKAIIDSQLYKDLFWTDYQPATKDNQSIINMEPYVDAGGVVQYRPILNPNEEPRNVQLSYGQDAKTRYDTTESGFRIASSVSGLGTGEHPDRILVDDHLKTKDARSKRRLDESIEWNDGTLSTRRALDPVYIFIMQRLNRRDLSGHNLAKGGWEHIILTMRYRPKMTWDCSCHKHGPDHRDQRTVEGELLFPQKFPEDKVREMEIELHRDASGQLDQRPTSEGGDFFKRDWFNLVEVAPADCIWCRGWDTAATKDGGDWTAGVLIGWSPSTEMVYVKHVVRWRVAEADKVIYMTATTDGIFVMVREEQEPGASGKAVIAAHLKKLKGYDYKGVPISGDKPTRARPFRAQCEGGNVNLVTHTPNNQGELVFSGEWIEPYLDELCAFDTGEHDDQVDASSCAYNALVLEPKKKKVSPVARAKPKLGQGQPSHPRNHSTFQRRIVR